MKHHLVDQPGDTYSTVKRTKEMESSYKSIWPTDISKECDILASKRFWQTYMSKELDILASKRSLSKLSYLNQQFTLGLESIDFSISCKNETI